MREGDRFDHYLLKQQIASGGMAAIFRAERVGAMNISREVCIKCILPALCRDEEFVRMFIDEARISSTLRHSNIVSIDHFGTAEGALFMCMEWVNGTDASKVLKRLLAEGRSLPVDAALFITAEVLKALEYAHGKAEGGRWLQIVHRDVTPHNVMVSYSGEVKLTDFGIAKATSRLHQTTGDVIKGKVAYMAPEQATGGALDHRTDLFAMGVVAYELLAGRRPFVGASQVDGVHAMLRGERPPLRALRPEVPPEAERIVDRLLEGDPDRRFPDAGAARDALDRVPALATGQRTLQRLMRELFPDEQHSTVLPRFASAASPADLFAPPPDASAATLTTPTVQTPPPRTEALRSFDAGPTAPRALDGDATQVSRPPVAEPPVATHARVTPTPMVSAVARPPPIATRSRVVPAAALAGVALAAVAGAVMLTRRSEAPVATASSQAPRPAPAPAPAVETRALTPAPAAAPDAAAPDAAAQTAEVVREDDEGAAQPAGDGGAEPATLRVVAIPWGRITVDGRTVNDRGVFRLPPGSYRVVARRNGREVSTRVHLRAGETDRVELDFRERGDSP